MPAGPRLLLRGCQSVAQIQGIASLWFIPVLLLSAKETPAQNCWNTALRPLKGSELLLILTLKSMLTLWYFTCFAKDKPSWDCTDSVEVPVCRLFVSSVNGHYPRCFSYMLQSVCSEEFVGLSGRDTKQLDSENDPTHHFCG